MTDRTDSLALGYTEQVRLLSEASVTRRFDPYLDIDWDSPELQIDRDDPRWVLPESDILGGHPWYRSQTLERRIEIGRWRTANIVKVGLQFESLLIRGMQQLAMNFPNGSPEFRYCLHEMTEECNHIMMFQELVNRIGEDVPGMRPLYARLSPLSPLIAGLPVLFLMGVLAGEEPIDHRQKAWLRGESDLPPTVLRTMQIHVAEEARHISFAHQFLDERLRSASRPSRAVASMFLPFIMRFLCGAIMVPPPEFARRFDIPRSVMREAFWSSPLAAQTLSNYFTDVRKLAHDTGLMNPAARQFWRVLGIDGRPSRYRSEPLRAR